MWYMVSFMMLYSRVYLKRCPVGPCVLGPLILLGPVLWAPVYWVYDICGYIIYVGYVVGSRF